MTSQERSIWKEIAKLIKQDIRSIVDLSLAPGDHREEIFNASWRAQKKLAQILKSRWWEGVEHFDITDNSWKNFLKKLGLTSEIVQFKYEGQLYGKPEIPKLEVHKVRPVYRVGREGKIVEQILITLTQTIHFGKGLFEGTRFRGGCTLILNMSGDYDVEYIIYKNVRSQHRFNNQMDHQLGKTEGSEALTDSMYATDRGFDKINIAQLHS